MSTLRPDRPISGGHADLLERGTLVNAIVNQILAAPNDGKAITIGLHAQWGAGKSSFLNLLQERLNTVGASARPDADGNTNPIVIRFNPWLFGSIEQLIRMFFADLAREVDQREPALEVGKLLEAFGVIVAAASTVFPTGASELAKLLATKAKLLGQAAQKPPSLDQQKAAINDALSRSPRRIVVFIDDVDRLEPDLTTLFFRMVRLSANFNNVIYVLAFDRAVVERHLAHDSPGFGREYLEKIIQVSYNIPPPHPRIIPCLLKDEMTQVRRAIERTVFDDKRYDRLFDTRRYDLVFRNDFAEHFATVRSIKRYVNALRLTLPPVAGQVDLVDFYVIELIRLLYPDVYLEITQHKDMLLHPDADDDIVTKRRQWLGKLRKSSIPAHLCDSVQSLLCVLFPYLVESESDTRDEAAIRSRWANDRRVCSPSAFDRFFSLAGEEGEAVEIRASIELGVTSDTGIQELFQYARRTGTIGDILHALRNHQLARREAMRVAMAICASDTRDDLQLPDVRDSYQLIGDVVKHCMERFGQGNEFRFLSALIAADGPLFTISKVFEEIQQLQVVVGQNAPRLRENLGGRILADAGREGFWDGNRWYYLLCVARRLGFVQEVLEEVERRVVERRDGRDVWQDDRLLRFWEMFPEVVQEDRERGGPAGGVEDIESWLPEEAIDRLKTLVDKGGEDGNRAKALVRRLGSSVAV